MKWWGLNMDEKEYLDTNGKRILEVASHLDSIRTGRAKCIMTNIPKLAALYRSVIKDVGSNCKVIETHFSPLRK